MFSMQNMARYRKGVVAVVAGVAEIVSLGVLHGTALVVAEAVLAAAQAAGVIGIKNDR